MEEIIPLRIKDVYGKLLDAESRLIFQHRLNYFLDGNIGHLHTMFSFLERDGKLPGNNVPAFVAQYHREPAKIVLYGAGLSLEAVLFVLSHYNLEAACVCDKNPAKQGQTIRGLPVISPEELLAGDQEAYIVISSYDYREEIRSFLLANGVSEDRIFTPNYHLQKQYFIPEITPVENEIMIDAGCYNGDTIRDFIDFCGGRYQKIYGLEPDPLNYAKTVTALADCPNTVIRELAVWREPARLPFTGQGALDACIRENGPLHIMADAIDNIVGDDPVTFIKMDVEGAELAALRGAEHTITANKPRLAICIYHKPEDILSIPLYILSLVPEYRFFIRQHYFNTSETVLYAVLCTTS